MINAVIWGKQGPVADASDGFDAIDVRWKNGSSNRYRWGKDSKYDVLVVKHPQ